ncbi:MAG: DUF2715 domain-containing protein [Chitinophagaceae bacterium]|nr:DUF2715 domain-containing protein [Chitinophagaceae bacterium]
MGSLFIHLPIGEFASTHFIGAGVGYSWSNKRFGVQIARLARPISFSADAGIDFFAGRSEKVAGYQFRYGSYWYGHVMGGMIYNVSRKANIRLLAGPTVSMYKNSIRAGIGARVDGSYYFTEKIGISPVVFFRKHEMTSALWSVGVSANYVF